MDPQTDMPSQAIDALKTLYALNYTVDQVKEAYITVADASMVEGLDKGTLPVSPVDQASIIKRLELLECDSNPSTFELILSRLKKLERAAITPCPPPSGKADKKSGNGKGASNG